ncbi:MAG TPA: YDG domain-containing protein [Sphingomonas sp.]|nr:YDG domain-containing protein [Sphingomonas sp.]
MKGVVNNSGTIEARTIGSRNGRIYLLGDMANGAVDVSGTLDASAPQGGDGGFIETSAAKVHIADGTRITTAAPLGRTGTFLIDPHDFRIAGTGDNEDITGTALTALLQSTNVTIESSAGAASGGGAITLADDVSYFANTLTLTAARDINIGAELNVLGTGTLVLNTATANGGEAGVPGGTVNVTIVNDLSGFAGRVTFDRTGTGLLTINGEAYTVVDSIADLQNITTGANARYALGADIDASATAGWNAGAGWAPIANFLGVFDGLGHSVDGLALARPGEFETGLFGQLPGTARNLNVSNADIRAGASVGVLAGFMSGTAHHVLVSGQVRGGSEAGGLAGYIIIQSPTAAPTLSDVHAAVTVTSTSDRVGGLVGYIDSASLRNVSASGSVTGRYRVGGLIGVVEGSAIASIQGARASGATSGQWYVGGLIGRLTNIGLTDATASGAVSNLPYTDRLTSFVSAFGGLIGQATDTQISDAAASGSITIVGNRDIDSVGGLIGYGNAISVLDSSATGPVSVTTEGGLTAWRIGGLIGFADQAAVSDPVSTFTRVHAEGNVQIVSGADSFYIGGLVGQARASLISDAGADGQVGVTSQGDMQYLGGLVGESTGGTVSRATALGDVSGISSAGGTATTSAFGGLIGSATGLSLTDVSASGDVSLTGDRNLSANGDAGGLIGTGLGIQLTRASASGEVTSNASRVGGLMGSLYSDTLAVLVSDVSASGSVFATNANPVFSAHVGGLIGTVDSSGAFGSQPLVAIRNATATGATVSGGSYVGGLAGQFAGDSIQFATASANVIAARQYAGGLVGALGIGTIADASAHGNVTAGSGGSAGGLVGSASVPTYSGLARVTATGNVSSTGNHVGGLVGYNGSLIQDALATGSVQGNLYVGGLAGFNDGQVLRAFASGRVTGADPTRTGGLIGFLDPNGTVGVSFYDRSRSGMFDAGKGTALSLAQAADPFTFIDAGWDFASVWGTPRAGGNPMLRGQTATALYDYYVRISGGLSRTYGDANPALSGVALDGVGTGNLLLGWGAAAGAGANAGAYGWLSPGLLSFGYATGSAADYYIAQGSGGLTIDPRVLLLSGARSYDATTDLAASVFTLGNLANGETLVLTGIGQLADKSAGTARAVSRGTLALADGTGLASNYTLAGGTHVADIGTALITLSGVAAANKVYDGGLIATLDTSAVSMAGLFGGDDVAFGSATGAFLDKNAGTGKTVVITGGTLTGADAANYSFAPRSGATADITPATISAITGIGGGQKLYDKRTDTVLDLSTAAFVGMIAGDQLEVASATGEFADKNAGINKTVHITGLSLGGADAGNYVLADTTATALGQIDRFGLATLSNLNVATRSYDGTTTATLDLPAVNFDDMLAGDQLTLVSASASFADASAGTGKLVNLSGMALGGADAGNYYLVSPTTTTSGTITRATLSLAGFAAANKIYDGGVGATITSAGTLTGLFGSDSVGFTHGPASFGDRNVGTARTVTLGGIALTGADAANYVIAGTATASADITPKTISAINGLSIQTRSYDGTTNATLDMSGVDLVGALGGDVVGLVSYKASFDTRNAGAGKTVNVTGLRLGGADAGNYVLASTGATLTGEITRAVLTLSGVAVADKIYDGTTNANVTSWGTLAGVLAGESVAVGGGSIAFADRNAGIGKSVSLTGLTLSGADAGNYALATTAATTASIQRATISEITGIKAIGKIYDGTTAAALDTSHTAFAGMIAGDTLTLASATGFFTDKNAGTGKTVYAMGLSLGGVDAGNYMLASATAVTSADIARATITSVSGIVAAGKTYDGSTTATLDSSGAGFAGRIGGDQLTVATATGSFADKNAGTGKTVTITGLSLGGADAGNYVLATTSAATTADVARAVISGVSGIAATDKVYDGTTGVALDTSGASFAGAVAGDALTIAAATGRFSDKNAGTGKTVSITGLSLGGDDAGNYVLASTSAVASADIARATISAVTGIAAASKTYDGTTAAMLDSASARFAGMVAGDSLTVATASGAFADKNAGAGKTVSITGLSLGGADAGNYVLGSTSAAATADIARAAITGISGIRAAGKTYDGTVTASIDPSGAILAGAIAGDSLTVSGTGSFADKNAGTGKTVNVTGLVLGGADAGNYDLTSTVAAAQADIARASITGVTGIGARDKTYDGTGVAQLDTSGAAFVGMIAGDSLAITGNGAFVDRNAGTGKTVVVTGLALAGADANNYVLDVTTATTSATISRATIGSVTGIAAAGKTYDGTTSATLDLSGAGFAGMIAGDSLTLASATGTFADKNAGTGKTVSITGLSLGGADAGNYVLASDSATARADIARAVVTVAGITAASKVYDGTTRAALNLSDVRFNGLVAGDTLTIAAATGTFADKNAGENKTVNVSGIHLGGADAGNYVVGGNVATAATIERRVIGSISGIEAWDKLYDGATAASLDTTRAMFDGAIAGDLLSVASAVGSFADVLPGRQKTVAISGLTLGGADADNYHLASDTAAAFADILWQANSPLLPDQRDKARIEGFAGASGVLLADPELVDDLTQQAVR